MTLRKQALVAKFRATTTERVRQLLVVLLGWTEREPPATELDTVKRNLHTMKGEARMLGFVALAELSHAIEQALEVALAATGAKRFERMRRALTAIDRALAGAFGDDEATTAALTAERQQLVAVDETTPARPEPEPAPVVEARQRWVQVDMQHVEVLCERIATLSADLRRLGHHLRRPATRRSDERALAEKLARCLAQAEEVDEAAWRLRMVPLDPVFATLVTHAHELAAELGKTVRVVTRGGDVALERNVLDALDEPLLHLLRNALDHGIEADRGAKPAVATIELVAEQTGAHVQIEVADDGRGLDAAAIRRSAIEKGLLAVEAAPSDEELHGLLFHPGFTTRAEVSEVSGRGVGLEAVRTALDRIGGGVRIASTPGRGTRFIIRVPIVIGKEHVLVVDCGGAPIAIAARDIASVRRVEPAATHVVVDDRELRIGSLARVFGQPVAASEPWVLIVEHDRQCAALRVRGLLGEAHLVIHPADPLVASGGLARGTTVLDDGTPVVVASARELVAREAAPAVSRLVAALDVLVVDDSAMIRALVSEIVERAGLRVRTAADGVEGLAAIEQQPPDLVVSDLEMPNMDGFELLQRVRAREPRLPFILLTSRGGDDDRARARSLGVSEYLVKADFGETTLLDAIARHCDRGVA